MDGFLSCGAEGGFVLEDGERSLMSLTKARSNAAAEDGFDPLATASSSSSELKSIRKRCPLSAMSVSHTNSANRDESLR